MDKPKPKSQSMIDEVLRIVTALENDSLSSRRAVELRIGGNLAPAPGATGGNDLYDDFEGQSDSEALGQFVYREPVAARRTGNRIVTLHVREGVHVLRTDFPGARLGSTDRLFPGQGGKVISVHTSPHDDHSTEWVFDEQGQLQTVTVTRPVHRD